MMEIQKITKSIQSDSTLHKSNQNKIINSSKQNNEEGQKDFLKLQAILESKTKIDKTQKSNPSQKPKSQGIPELKVKDPIKNNPNNSVITKKHDEQKKQTKELVVKQKEGEKHHVKQEIGKFDKVQKQIKTNPSTSAQQAPKQKEVKDNSYQPLKIHKPMIKDKVVQKDDDEAKVQQNEIIIQKKNNQNNDKQVSIKKDNLDETKKPQPVLVANQQSQKQQIKKDLGEEKLMQLLLSSSNKNTKKSKNKEKEKQEQIKSKESKGQNPQFNSSINRDKIKELQSQKSKPFSIKPQIKDLSIQKLSQQKNYINDDYDLDDSFINDSESVDVEIDPKEVVTELKKLQRKKEGRKQGDLDDDIEEAGFDVMLKEEKKSRVLGIIDDYREEKYIKKEIKKEKQQKKKLMEMKNKQENKKEEDAQ
ncbi:unnamed protein product (macronuclear) [Paramecium tetraurelia]|uniref:Uncharacterized protein n=1 Tax=Paramecium tetraurelia TaxID=5888 RepID=A0BYM8_PARTE|nr:uncharacterized protein GSPATT00033498001 [Paramecium tetraurelia]CAK63645.1 unnamed protein product [Paramecium tetraurelia]|eukprot:XP_001431043.1 hypothetical protein (macronuclear) [Paramecium tetraurelia strain d4-2]